MGNAKNIFPDIKTVCSETFYLFRLHSRAESETNDQAKVSAGTDLGIQFNSIIIKQLLNYQKRIPPQIRRKRTEKD
jgi:hypothetical protein